MSKNHPTYDRAYFIEMGRKGGQKALEKLGVEALNARLEDARQKRKADKEDKEAKDLTKDILPPSI